MSIGEIPSQQDWIVLRKRLDEMRTAINSLLARSNPPRPVVNLTATAKAGGVIVMFTKTDGDNYILYHNATANLDGATRIDLGNSGKYVDDIGKSALTRYYWVRAKKGNLESAISGPATATTLALTADVTPPVAPPANDEPVFSDEYGYPVEK